MPPARPLARRNPGPCEAVPVGPDRSELIERFRRAVEARAGHRFRGLRVEAVGDAGWVLHGRTDCYYAKQLAQHVFGRLTGSAVLANRIEVDPPPTRGDKGRP